MKTSIFIATGILTLVILFGGTLYAANGDLVVNGNLSVGTAIRYPDNSLQTSAWLPAGTIIMFGSTTAPTGWMIADGSAVSRSTYSALFAVIGTTYGAGDESSTFNLPDFRGVFPKGAGTTDRAAGVDASGNHYSGALGDYSQDKMQGHWHKQMDNNGAGGSTLWGYQIWSGNRSPNLNDEGFNAIGGPKSDGTNGIPRTGHTTEPQSLGVNFIIKY